MEKSTKLEELTYEELEQMADEVLKKLSDTSLPLDKASALYEQGKAISKEMENRLAVLEKTVTDEIK